MLIFPDTSTICGKYIASFDIQRNPFSKSVFCGLKTNIIQFASKWVAATAKQAGQWFGVEVICRQQNELFVSYITVKISKAEMQTWNKYIFFLFLQIPTGSKSPNPPLPDRSLVSTRLQPVNTLQWWPMRCQWWPMRCQCGQCDVNVVNAMPDNKGDKAMCRSETTF